MDTGPAIEWAEARTGDGTSPPSELVTGDAHIQVVRTFCFVDLTGFTGYTRRHGPHQAVELLAEFRRVTRLIAARRGVRVAKWLGDGAMLVGIDAGPTIALGGHLIHQFADTGIEVRVGIATGSALLFEGDDYIGEPVNLAAKLCAAARSVEILAATDLAELPEWIEAAGEVDVDIGGVGVVGGVHRLVTKL